MTGITDHAKKRIRKRIGTKNPDKSFGEALMYGTKFSETKGDLKRFLTRKAVTYHSDAIIYQGYIFWHKKTVLITVIPLPHKFIKYIKKEKPNVPKTKK